ncbi:hypothetical protein Ndes2526B_g07695 [Nannochloris sp. 'desiccata']
MGDFDDKHPPILALPGPQYPFDYSKGLPIGNNVIIVHQEGGQGRGTAWAVWDGATAVALHLDCLLKIGNQSPWLENMLKEKNNDHPFIILEVGSGTGLAGLAAASAFQEKAVIKVILTDLAEALPALKSNVCANPSFKNCITVTECDWFNPDVVSVLKILSSEGSETKNITINKISLIIAADCVWLEHLVAPFIATIEKIIKEAGSIETRVLLGYQSRSQRVDDLLFGLLKKNFIIEVAEMLTGECDRELFSFLDTMARSIAILALAMFAMLAVASAADACAYPVTKWNRANYKLGAATAPSLPSTCPSGFTARPDTTPLIESSVLTQTLVQQIWPKITGDDVDVYTCPEGLKWIQFQQISSCIGNNARNPRFARVNGLAQFVCKNQARIRSISIRADVNYSKVC